MIKLEFKSLHYKPFLNYVFTAFNQLIFMAHSGITHNIGLKNPVLVGFYYYQ